MLAVTAPVSVYVAERMAGADSSMPAGASRGTAFLGTTTCANWRRASVGRRLTIVVMLGVAPLTGSGFFCLKLGAWAPGVVALFHVSYGAILGLVYGKLLDTDDARYAARH